MRGINFLLGVTVYALAYFAIRLTWKRAWAHYKPEVIKQLKVWRERLNDE